MLDAWALIAPLRVEVGGGGGMHAVLDPGFGKKWGRTLLAVNKKNNKNIYLLKSSSNRASGAPVTASGAPGPLKGPGNVFVLGAFFCNMSFVKYSG